MGPLSAASPLKFPQSLLEASRSLDLTIRGSGPTHAS